MNQAECYWCSGPRHADGERCPPWQAAIDRQQAYQARVVHVADFTCGGYNSGGTLDIHDGECSVCKRETRVLECDGSMGEYFNGQICRACALKAFDEDPHKDPTPP